MKIYKWLLCISIDAMGDNDYIEIELEFEENQWYSEFTKIWTCSIAIDATNPDPCRYGLRVVGPNGEAAKQTQLEPESVPREIRAEFEDAFREGATHA